MKNKIKLLRAERKITQEELAQILDVTRQTVIAIEREKYSPSLPLAFKIARFFEVSIESVFEPDENE